jgi:hypothetical protein
MKTKLAILSMAGLIAMPAAADIQIHGFANLVGGITLDDEETLYDYDSDFNFDPASVFGLQIRGEVNDKLSATAQLVGRGSEDYDAAFEWAYMTYTVTPNTSISAGRLRVPFFKYSSSLDVGYSYHWITPPDSVYGIDFNNIDGVRIDYQNYAGEWEYGAQLTLGHIQADTEIAGTEASIEINNAFTISIDVSRDWFSARALVGTGKVTAQNDDFDTLISGISAYGAIIPTATAAANNLNIADDTGIFLEATIGIDKYDWFMIGEYTSMIVNDSIIADTDAWYLTAGMRFGKFTPHITFESERSGITDREVYIADLPSAIDSGDATLDDTWSVLYQAAADAVATQEHDTTAITAGLRYDIDPGLALKVSVTKYNNDLVDAKDATLLRVAANYTF